MSIVHTRRPLLGRIKARIACMHLRFLILHAERDMRHHQADLEWLPKQIDGYRRYIDELTLALVRAQANV